MPFQKGHKFSPGGKKGGKGGRPLKQKTEAKKLARDIAREFIEKHAKPVLDSYLKNAKGYFVKRFTETGQEYEEFIIDPPSTRHFVDRLVPPAKQEVDVNVHGQVQVFTNVDPYAGRTKKS